MSHSLSIKILVIDEDTQILNLMTRILGLWGIEPETVSDGSQGLELIQSKDYNLVITEIIVPELSGIEICEFLCQQSRERNKEKIPVIGMSGTPWLLGQGKFDAMLIKPFTMDDTIKILNRFLPVFELGSAFQKRKTSSRSS